MQKGATWCILAITLPTLLEAKDTIHIYLKSADYDMNKPTNDMQDCDQAVFTDQHQQLAVRSIPVTMCETLPGKAYRSGCGVQIILL